MKLVRARNNKNQAEIMDDRPFVIEEIELYNSGFRIVLLDIQKNSDFRRIELWYGKREWFDEEWELIDNINYQVCSFDLINYHQE